MLNNLDTGHLHAQVNLPAMSEMPSTAHDPNYPPLQEQRIELVVPPGQKPMRLDVYLANTISHATRTRIQEAIEAGLVTIEGRRAKASSKVQPGDRITCCILRRPPIELVPEQIPLDILYEDEDVLVVNKPAGMVVHPAYGNRTGTLVNAVLYHLGVRERITIADEDDLDEETESLLLASAAVRPGIVHRLDKDTSGVLVVAKNERASEVLSRQFAERRVHRIYHGFVWGILPDDSGTIDAPIGRSPRDRKLFSVLERGGKHAVTTYRVLERYAIATRVELKLHTGRTHQIRVHMAYIRHPLIGDAAYGGAAVPSIAGLTSPRIRPLANACAQLIQRQALHASVLGFFHPRSGTYMEFSAPLPDDLERLRLYLERTKEADAS
ncbi:MAG: pseudouridine synthase [Candidatus Kapaibacterium sp.]|nr:MAG: pseudouridine synthase [Candidatus Kapabacteria bacterium]